MNISVMQPYIFPYIGYFNLIMSSDIFVLYDDVNFMKQSYINRNNILLDSKIFRFTIPVPDASANVLIKDLAYSSETSKLLKTFYNAYHKAPYFKKVFPLIEQSINYQKRYISELCLNSLIEIFNYLEINKKIVLSSQLDYDRDQTASEKLVSICKLLGGHNYINSLGGIGLYEKSMFEPFGINLQFIAPRVKEYRQLGNGPFIPSLSIMDILMNNSVSDVKEFLLSYRFVD